MLISNVNSGGFKVRRRKFVKTAGGILLSGSALSRAAYAQDSDLYMPNAFSPNGDGLNDMYPNNQYQDIGVEYNLKIFTRWGEKLEDFDSPSYSWDGNYKGEAMAEGVYIYIINWIGCDNKRRQKSGNVTLIK